MTYSLASLKLGGRGAGASDKGGGEDGVDLHCEWCCGGSLCGGCWMVTDEEHKIIEVRHPIMANNLYPILVSVRNWSSTPERTS